MYDKLTEREKKILLILSEVDGYIKCERIANQISKSAKTVANDIRIMNSLSNDAEYYIDSKRNNGFKLIIRHFDAFERLISSIRRDMQDVSLDDKHNKSYDLLCCLLNSETPISIQALEHVTHLSESVVRNELRKLLPILNKHHLQLSTKKCVKILGEEHDIRFLISHILIKEKSTGSIRSSFKKKFFNKPILMHDITTRLEYILIKYNDFTLSKKAINLLAVYLMVSDSRNRNNKYITINCNKSLHAYVYEGYVAKEMIAYLKTYQQYFLTEYDASFLTLLLALYGTPKRILEKNMDNTTIKLFDYIINYICEITKNYSFRNDTYFCEQLYTYLYAKELRDTYKIYNEALPFSTIKRKRIISVETAILVCQMMENIFHIPYTEKEVITLTTCVGNMFSKSGLYNKKRRIVVASKYGVVESRRVVGMMHVNFNQYIAEITPLEIYELNEILLTKYDFIITDDSDLTAAIPIYYLNKYAQQYEISSKLKNTIQNRINDSNKFLSLIGDNIYPNITLANKKEVFDYINKLYQHSYATHKNIVRVLSERNGLVSYEVGNRTALIFLLDEHVSDVCFHFLVLKKPILWDSESVSLVIVLLAGNENVTSMRYLGGHLPLLLENIGFINEFISYPSIDTLKRHLNT